MVNIIPTDSKRQNFHKLQTTKFQAGKRLFFVQSKSKNLSFLWKVGTNSGKMII